MGARYVLRIYSSLGILSDDCIARVCAKGARYGVVQVQQCEKRLTSHKIIFFHVIHRIEV